MDFILAISVQSFVAKYFFKLEQNQGVVVLVPHFPFNYPYKYIKFVPPL
jgi:hypothetical protein